MKIVMVRVAGVVMLLSCIAHSALGWPAMRAELEQASVQVRVMGALAVVWYFGSVAMAVFGIVMLACAAGMKRGEASSVTVARVVAAGYLLFGLSAFFLRDFNPHFLVFVATGLLAGIPVLRGVPTPGGSAAPG